jgi:hypothetical protein
VLETESGLLLDPIGLDSSKLPIRSVLQAARSDFFFPSSEEFQGRSIRSNQKKKNNRGSLPLDAEPQTTSPLERALQRVPSGGSLGPSGPAHLHSPGRSVHSALARSPTIPSLALDRYRLASDPRQGLWSSEVQIAPIEAWR